MSAVVVKLLHGGPSDGSKVGLDRNPRAGRIGSGRHADGEKTRRACLQAVGIRKSSARRRRCRGSHGQRDGGAAGARLGVGNGCRNGFGARACGRGDCRLEREDIVSGNGVPVSCVVIELLRRPTSDAAEVSGHGQPGARGIRARRDRHRQQGRGASLDRVWIRRTRSRRIGRAGDETQDRNVVDGERLRIRRSGAGADGIIPCQIKIAAVGNGDTEGLIAHRDTRSGRGGETVIVRVGGEVREEGGSGAGPRASIQRVEQLKTETGRVRPVPVFLNVVRNLETGKRATSSVDELRV